MMEHIIWNVTFAGSSRPDPGAIVTCLWNREGDVYDVYYRGCLCGIVDEIFRAGRTEPDFLSGKVLQAEDGHAQICIRRHRDRARMAAGIGGTAYLRIAA